MTRSGIIVVAGLTNSVNLRPRVRGLARNWLRGLVTNAALAPRTKQVSMPSHVHTNAEDKAAHTLHTRIMQSFCVFSLRHMKGF